MMRDTDLTKTGSPDLLNIQPLFLPISNLEVLGQQE